MKHKLFIEKLLKAASTKEAAYFKINQNLCYFSIDVQFEPNHRQNTTFR
jgi:hypothetical protein